MILTGFAAMICLTAVGGTAALFRAKSIINNQLSVGYNTITIKEDFTPPKEMNTGENTYKKNVEVKNTGTVPCYVRVYVAFSDSNVAGVSELSPDGSSFFSAESYADHLPEHWTYIEEPDDAELGGYYYYTEPVAAGKTTDALFEKVKTTFQTAADVQDYEIIVYAESVQTADKDGAEFTGSDPWKQAWTEFLSRK